MLHTAGFSSRPAVVHSAHSRPSLKFGIELYALAGNQQHMHCDLSNVLSSVNGMKALERCITATGHWMSANWLKRNAQKSEMMCASITQDAGLTVTVQLY